MTDPTFRQLWQSARAHQGTPAPPIGEIDPDAITVFDGLPNSGAGNETESPVRPTPLPGGWPDDGRFVEPRRPPAPPHVFDGPVGAIEGYPEDGRNAWRAANDAAIVAAVNRHNAERKLYPGDAEFMTPKVMKSWMMQESGGSRGAFERDPFQVNNPGDWAEEKRRIAGLQQDQVMTPQTSADASLKWLAYKGRLHRGEGGRLGPYWTPFEAFRNYNGNTNAYRGREEAFRGMRHQEAYANLILNRVKE